MSDETRRRTGAGSTEPKVCPRETFHDDEEPER
jgi:hypothetical protein